MNSCENGFISMSIKFLMPSDYIALPCSVRVSQKVTGVSHSLTHFERILTERIIEQFNLKFCTKLGKSPSETFLLLKQVFDDAC